MKLHRKRADVEKQYKQRYIAALQGLPDSAV